MSAPTTITKAIAAEQLATDLAESARAAEAQKIAQREAPVFDLEARRAARPVDKGQVIANIEAGVNSLHETVARWPYTMNLRESHLIGAERSLVALQILLIDLRAFVPATDSAK